MTCNKPVLEDTVFLLESNVLLLVLVSQLLYSKQSCLIAALILNRWQRVSELLGSH